MESIVICYALHDDLYILPVYLVKDIQGLRLASPFCVWCAVLNGNP